MSGFLFAFLATLLAGAGTRDQLTVAALAQRNGAGAGLLVTAIAAACLAAGVAAWAATAITPLLPGDARRFLAALALGMAGAEMLLFSPARKPAEPTRSLGAAGIVLLAQQLTDAARFLIFAIAAATSAALVTGIGGAAGGAAVVTAAWLAPELVQGQALRTIRRVAGGALLLLAIVLGLQAIGRI